MPWEITKLESHKTTNYGLQNVKQKITELSIILEGPAYPYVPVIRPKYGTAGNLSQIIPSPHQKKKKLSNVQHRQKHCGECG